jgi:hypothetical protein
MDDSWMDSWIVEIFEHFILGMTIYYHGSHYSFFFRDCHLHLIHTHTHDTHY